MPRQRIFLKREPLQGLGKIVGTALAALAAGCAQVQQPPGGPPDFDPPVLVSVRPDSGAVFDQLDDPAEFQFDEVITEPTSQAAGRLFVLSPRPRELDVDWKRTRLTVRPDEGWRSGVVYRLALLPQITDLRNNRIDSGRVIVFAVGRSIPNTQINGRVVDWEGRRLARNALVEAVSQPDSIVYFTLADSAGSFDLRAVPPATYTLFGIVDGNNNRLRDRGEAFDSATVILDSTLNRVFWAFRHDTTGPQISNTIPADTFTIRVEFSQSLAPGPLDPTLLRVFALPDTTPVPITSVWQPAEYDSVTTEERERARAAADSAQAAADTTAVADTVAVAVADTARAPPDTAEAPPDSAALAADSAAAAATQLLAQRPTLIDRIFLRVETPLLPGGRFLVTATMPNIEGYVAESRAVLVIPGGEGGQ